MNNPRSIHWPVLAAVLLTCPGCVTAVLWDWAGGREGNGEEVGVVRDAARGDLLVYHLADAAGNSLGTWTFRVPRDWLGRRVDIVASAPLGDALALAEPLPAASDSHAQVIPLGAPTLPLHHVDYRHTIGPAEVRLGPNQPAYGVVELLDGNDNLIHEVYGFDPFRAQWIRLASIDLGPYGTDPGRVAAGIILTPLTVAADLTLIGLVCLAVLGGGNPHIDSLPDGDSTPAPVTFAERDEYWHGLLNLAAPAGR